jgi:hypothetical protein
VAGEDGMRARSVAVLPRSGRRIIAEGQRERQQVSLRRAPAKLQNKGAGDVYAIRAQVANKLRSLIDTILVTVDGERKFQVRFKPSKGIRWSQIVTPNPDNPREFLTHETVVGSA